MKLVIALVCLLVFGVCVFFFYNKKYAYRVGFVSSIAYITLSSDWIEEQFSIHWLLVLLLQILFFLLLFLLHKWIGRSKNPKN